MITMYESPTVAERFWAKVDKTDDCWRWTGAKQVNGYGILRVAGYGSTPDRAHRVAYTLAHGSIPAGLEIDHLCRNKECVRAEHLEAVTHAENCRRTIKCHCGKCVTCYKREWARRKAASA